MKMLNSLSGVWKDSRLQKTGDRLFVVIAVFLCALLVLLMMPRTMHGTGVVLAENWFYPLIGIVLFAIAMPATNIEPVARDPRSLCLLAAFGIPFADLEVAVGLGLVSIAGLGTLTTVRWIQPVARRFELLAATWLAMIGVNFVFTHVFSRVDSFEFLSAPVAVLLMAFGETLQVSGSTIFLDSEGKVVEILCSPDKFGGVFPVLLLTGLLLGGCYLRVSRKALLALSVALPVYASLRTAGILSAITHEAFPYRWWDEYFVSLSYLPFLLIFFVFSKGREVPDSSTVGGGFKWRLCVPALLGAAMLIFAWNWSDPGIEKNGVVVIDEAHSRWEWSEEPLTEDLYGVKTVYSYYCMAEQLKEDYEVRRNFDPITDETLSDVSVLILKTPTQPYPQESREAIWRFVENGGGVWLVGDHTDIFGMNTHLNSIGSRYGIELKADSVIDPETNRQITKPVRTSHPIARSSGLFLWYTGDSVTAPLGTKDVFVSNRMLRDGRDLAKNTYFGDFSPNLNEAVGPVLQAVALPVGKGRVAVWTDSTLFSNFSIFLPNKMELAEGYVDWLNRTNGPFTMTRQILLALGLLLVSIALGFSRGFAVPGFLWPGIAIGALLVFHVNGTNYPEPSKLQRTDVAFYEPTAPVYHMPVTIPFNDPLPGQYLTSFVASQRAGQRPAVAFNMDEALVGDTIVWIAPRMPDNENVEVVVNKMVRFVEDGGKLIILDGGIGDYRIMKTLLTAIGSDESVIARIERRNVDEAAERPEWVDQIVASHGAQSANGELLWMQSEAIGRDETEFSLHIGEPVLRFGDVDGPPVLVKVPLGKGEILLSSTRKAFSDLQIGASSDIPTRRQLVALTLLFDFFRDQPNETEQVVQATND
ncbi:MAG: hypothetical protein AAF456_10070 [Planctomycetota bacterium]